MVLSLHIIIALTSLFIGAVSTMRPSRQLLAANYACIAATFVSGAVLTVQHPAHLTSACVSGLCYLAAICTLTVVATRKFAHQTIQK